MFASLAASSESAPDALICVIKVFVVPASSTETETSVTKPVKIVVSTTVPVIQRAVANDTRVVSSTTARQVIVGYYDPLAQTFLVSPTNYPDGVFLSKLRTCFRSKDSTQPVTLQIRPTVNGYPSSSVVFPYSTVSLTPDKVKTTLIPDLDDASKYTEFEFTSPLYVEPGEYSFVVLSNSRGYEMYIAERNGVDIATGRLISEQPATTVIQELKACQGALNEIEEIAKSVRHNVKLLFTWGNHDIRFGNRLAQHAPQFKEVQGLGGAAVKACERLVVDPTARRL